MSMRFKAALVIMAIVFAFTSASFFLSMSFTHKYMTTAMEQELSLALDIADSLVTTKIGLLISDASTIAERLLKADTAEKMAEMMASQMEEFEYFISLTVCDRTGTIANYGEPIAHDVFLTEKEYIQSAFNGKRILSSTHYSPINEVFIIHVFVPMTPDKILSATIPGMIFSDLLSEYRLWQTGSIFMIDAGGTFIANYRPYLVLEQHNFINDSKTNPEMKTVGNFYQTMTSSDHGSGRYTFEGQERLCVYKHVTGSFAGWYIGVTAPLSEGPQKNVQNGLLLASLLFMAVGVIVSFFVSALTIKPFKKIEAQNLHLEHLNETVTAQAALIKYEHERAKLMLDATPLSCSLFYQDAQMFDCNEEAFKRFKMKNKQEYISKFHDISPEYQPDGQLSVEKATRNIQKAFAEGRYVFEWMHQMLDGTPMPAEVTLVRVKYADEYVVAGYMRDLREHKQMMNEIKQNSNMLNTMNQVANILLRPESDKFNDDILQYCMGMIGKAVSADRVCIWKNSTKEGKLCCSQIYEWVGDARLRTNNAIATDVPYEGNIPTWQDLLSQGNCINTLTRDLSPVERERMAMHDILSVFAAPVFIADEFWGFVGCDNCHNENVFTENEVSILHSGALFVANALIRNEMMLNIREAHNRIKLLLDATPLACRLWNRDFKIFDCNDKTVSLYGLKSKQEFMERYFDLSPEYQPDGQRSLDKTYEILEKVFKEGKYTFEWMHQLPDGTPLPAEITLVRLKYGDEDVIAGYTHDLREHKRMLSEIEQSANMLGTVNKVANILLQSESGEFESDLQRCMNMIGEAVNADRVYIWKNHSIEGRLHCTQLYEWSGGAEPQQHNQYTVDISYSEMVPSWEETLSQGNCINGLVRDMSPEEQAQLLPQGILSLFVAPVFMQDQFWGFVGYDNCHDEHIFTINEQTILRSGGLLIANALLRNEMTLSLKTSAIQLEEALGEAQEANQIKSSFLAKMSHEMRTPLNAIIGLSELTLEDNGVNEKVYSNIEKVYNAGTTLLSTVNDILDISKIEANKLEIVPVKYDIPSLLNDTVTQSIMHIKEKPINFVLDINESLPAQLYGDDLRIKQIFNNLLSNAFKYTEKGFVELGVRCSREDETVWMTVWIRDTGIGIHPDNISKLFDDYSQIDIKSNRRVMGTGLGLPIAKKLLDLMDGTVTVESEYGKGSIFTVRFPQKFVTDTVIGPEVVKSLKDFNYSEKKRQRDSKLSRISLPYARVLIVDDMATNLDVAKGLMKPYNMQIDCATSGQEAINAILNETVRYNAVFMDHMMPGIDGIEATRIIREIGTDYAKTVPIIAFTANAIIGNEEMFLSNGFQAFISKPIEITKLDAVIRKWVQDKEQEKLLFNQQKKLNGQILPNNQDEQERRAVSCRRSGIDRRALSKGITGLDIEKGIERFGGDEDTYFGILRSYAVNSPPLLETIKGVNKDNLDDYAIVIHGIKGASRGICANEFAAIAETLEKAAKAEDYEFVMIHNTRFLGAAWKLVAEIDDMLSQIYTDNPKPKKDKPLKETLDILLEACKNYDMDGVDTALAEIECYEYEYDGGLVAWLRVNVEQMNFPQIIERLSALNK